MSSRPFASSSHSQLRELGRNTSSRAAAVNASTGRCRPARSAGVRSVCVTYGYGHGTDFAAAGADSVIEGFGELPEALESLWR